MSVLEGIYVNENDLFMQKITLFFGHFFLKYSQVSAMYCDLNFVTHFSPYNEQYSTTNSSRNNEMKTKYWSNSNWFVDSGRRIASEPTRDSVKRITWMLPPSVNLTMWKFLSISKQWCVVSVCFPLSHLKWILSSRKNCCLANCFRHVVFSVINLCAYEWFYFNFDHYHRTKLMRQMKGNCYLICMCVCVCVSRCVCDKWSRFCSLFFGFFNKFRLI